MLVLVAGCGWRLTQPPAVWRDSALACLTDWLTDTHTDPDIAVITHLSLLTPPLNQLDCQLANKNKLLSKSFCNKLHLSFLQTVSPVLDRERDVTAALRQNRLQMSASRERDQQLLT